MPDFQMGAAEQKEARGETTQKLKPKRKAMEPHKLGNTEFYLEEQAVEALAIAKQMKKQGHAIGWDSTFNHDGTFARASVIHYLTCSCNQKAFQELVRKAKANTKD